MKKFFKISALVLAVVLVSGCGSKGKVLTCTMSEKESGMEISETVKITFESDKATKYSKVEKVVVDKKYKEYISTFAKSAENQYKAFKNEKGVTYKVTTKSNEVKVTFDADLTKASKTVKEELSVDQKATYAETKKAATDAGFKCK